MADFAFADAISMTTGPYFSWQLPLTRLGFEPTTISTHLWFFEKALAFCNFARRVLQYLLDDLNRFSVKMFSRYFF
jgi:hypothetical protein